MPEGQRQGPLQDVTIIDCTQALAGPFGTALLADLGANVIKVEAPSGDMFRPLPPFLADYAHAAGEASAGTDYGAPFAAVNRNKRSICLDLKDPKDKEVLLQLCEQADAIVENMRSGVMDKLGLSYEAIRERNPHIVYGAIRGFGDPRTGDSPYSQWPCLDVAAQSMGGLVDANDNLVNPAVADIYPGTLIALGLVSAIHHARETGEGQFVDTAMYDSVLTLLRTSVAAHGFSQKKQTGASKRPSALVPFGLFPASDGQIAIAAPQPNHWQKLCQAMDREDLLTDERTRSNGTRVRNRELVEQEISAWTQSQTRQQIFDVLGGAVPVGSAQNMAEIYADPHVEARAMLDWYQPPGDNPPVAIAGNPLKFTQSSTSFYQQPPLLGEHTAEILAEFGITRSD